MPVYKIQVKRYYTAEVIANCADEACGYVEFFKESDMVFEEQDLEVIETRTVTRDDL
jgi:predicted nucleic-acid-binding Zn-ribbon protein